MVTDDIVTRLRNISNTTEWVKLRDWTKITTDAADEIERLRAARNPKAVDDLYAMMVDWRSKALEAKAVAENYKKEVIRLANKIKEMNND